MDAYWKNPEAPWWAKLRRAGKHVDDVRSMVAAMERESPWTVETEPGRTPDETAYRLRVHSEIPADLVTVVGDAIHNMRSSLDTVAYELARQYVGGTLSEEQERASQFPICKDLQEFDRFFDGHRHRRTMYGDLERKALGCVQPYSFSSEAAALGVDVNASPDDDLRTDAIYRVHQLSNIDKHRRLPMLAWLPDMVYWTTPPDDNVYQWKQATSTPAIFRDNTILGYLAAPEGRPAPDIDVTHEIHLTLSDDPAYPSKIPDTLANWHRSLTNWILPRIFIVAAGYEPPIMI